MTENIFNIILFVWIAVAIIVFLILFFITAPYGRYSKSGWGMLVDNRLGWVLMEAPSFLIILGFTLVGDLSNYAFFLSVCWMLHYFNRSFVFPARLRTTGKKMPLSIILSAVFFNAMNAGTNGYFLAYFENYSSANFTEWNFYVGIGLFILGAYINTVSDHILINLRKPGETGYKIPSGFLYEYISCPNFFGEMIQWFGFAVMAFNLPALGFFVWTVANVFPRALNHHDWYREKFENYPTKRKAVIPFIK